MSKLNDVRDLLYKISESQETKEKNTKKFEDYLKSLSDDELISYAMKLTSEKSFITMLSSFLELANELTGKSKKEIRQFLKDKISGEGNGFLISFIIEISDVNDTDDGAFLKTR